MELAGHQRRPVWVWLPITLVLIALVASFAPLERTLGERARLVYFHGAWVWAGKAAFAAAAAAGLSGLLPWRAPVPRRAWRRASLALGWTGLFFWLTYLPLSVWVQQANWGGIFWDEPRWRIPLILGGGGLLLQAGLVLVEDLRLASGANLAFGTALWVWLGSLQNVLHPDSPIFGSGAVRIQVFFVILVILSLFFGAILAWQFFQVNTEHWK
jgi:hypothetical protein